MRDRAEFAGSVVHLDGHAIDETFDDDLAAQGVRFGDLHGWCVRSPNCSNRTC
ncbi:MAG: hypothetical protein Ct9H300mP1_15510 [Planctomycetaceae bacterium]|nr:MAG: hypothetical protein Ct9H300mP1_15510 [Planctomycetaceae bacterium]